jgi:hypothetical protein
VASATGQYAKALKNRLKKLQRSDDPLHGISDDALAAVVLCAVYYKERKRIRRTDWNRALQSYRAYRNDSEDSQLDVTFIMTKYNGGSNRGIGKLLREIDPGLPHKMSEPIAMDAPTMLTVAGSRYYYENRMKELRVMEVVDVEYTNNLWVVSKGNHRGTIIWCFKPDMIGDRREFLVTKPVCEDWYEEFDDTRHVWSKFWNKYKKMGTPLSKDFVLGIRDGQNVMFVRDMMQDKRSRTEIFEDELIARASYLIGKDTAKEMATVLAPSKKRKRCFREPDHETLMRDIYGEVKRLRSDGRGLFTRGIKTYRFKDRKASIKDLINLFKASKNEAIKLFLNEVPSAQAF